MRPSFSPHTWSANSQDAEVDRDVIVADDDGARVPDERPPGRNRSFRDEEGCRITAGPERGFPLLPLPLALPLHLPLPQSQTLSLTPLPLSQPLHGQSSDLSPARHRGRLVVLPPRVVLDKRARGRRVPPEDVNGVHQGAVCVLPHIALEQLNA